MQANPKPDDEVAERAILGKRIVKRAVAKLVGYGLIRLHGNTLLPTQAAYHCHRLDAW